MTLALVLLYKELLEASARQQRSDAARKLRAHREAWSANVQPAAPVAAPPPSKPPAAEGPAGSAREDDVKPGG